jgi:hypothetical protein
LLGGDQQQAADEDMKEEDEEEKVAEHGVRGQILSHSLAHAEFNMLR